MFLGICHYQKSLVKVHGVHKGWKIRNKNIIHKPMNQGQSTKHKSTDMCYSSRDTNEIKLIGKEIEISQINHTISTHGATNALNINTMTKRNKLSNKKSNQVIKSEGSTTLKI